MSVRIPQLNFEKLIECFKSRNISGKDYLSQQQLQKTLAELNNSPFDDQTFQQLWDQCRLNSKGQAKVEDFVEYMIKAQEILIDKLTTLETNIVKMELQEKPKLEDYVGQKKYKQEIQVLKDQKRDAKLSLNFIRHPFEHFVKQQGKLLSKQLDFGVSPDQVSGNHDQKLEDQLFQYDVTTTANILTKILYGTLCLLALCCLGNYLFNRFFDMTLCFSILVSYVCQSINRKIVKLYLLLLVVSFVLKLIWLLIYVNALWSLNQNYDFPQNNGSYAKLSVVLLILSQIVKLVLIYYFLTQMHINEMEVYTIYIGSKTLFMQNNPHSHETYKDPLGGALMKLCQPAAQVANQNQQIQQ